MGGPRSERWSGCTGVEDEWCGGWRPSRSAWSWQGHGGGDRLDRPAATIGDGLEPMISTSIALAGAATGHDSSGTVKVNALAKIGNTLYVGGQFTQIAPERLPNTSLPAGSGIPRPYLFAADATTGPPIWSFGAVVDGPVYALEVDPATNTLYVGGRFIDGGRAGAVELRHPRRHHWRAEGRGDPAAGHRAAAPTSSRRSTGTRSPTSSTSAATSRPSAATTAAKRPGSAFRATRSTTGSSRSAGRSSPSGSTRPTQPPPVSTSGASSRPPPATPSFAYIARFDSTDPADRGDGRPLDTTWDPSLTGFRDPPGRGGSPWSGATCTSASVASEDGSTSSARPTRRRRSSSGCSMATCRLVYPIGNEVLVGGHFTRFYNRPDPVTGGNVTLALPDVRGSGGGPDQPAQLAEPARLQPLRARSPSSPRTTTPTARRTTPTGAATSGASPRAATRRPCRSTPTSARASAVRARRGRGAACGTSRRRRRRHDEAAHARPGLRHRVVHQRGRVLAGGERCQRHRRLLRLREQHAQEGRARRDSRARILTGFTADSVNSIRVRAIDPATNFRDFPTVTWTAPTGIPALPSPLKGFGLFNPTANPMRIFDTRNAIGRAGRQPVTAGATVSVDVVGQAGRAGGRRSSWP